MNKTLNWAIIGCGAISFLHLEALQAVENVNLYAVCDVIEERAKKRAEEYGADKIYLDYIELLNDSAVDVVSICTPSGMHGEMCIECAKHGKHILCEKPMEVTTEKIDALIDAVRKYGVKMECVFQRRYDKKFSAVKEAISSGRFGKVLLADAYLKYNRSQRYYDSAGWRATWDLDGGGALMNQGIHGIDLLTWIVGDVESVYARCRTQTRKIDVEDTAIASLQFKNGAVGNIEGTTCVYPAQETRLEIHCEKGSIIVSDGGILQWETEDGSETAPTIVEPVFAAKDDPTKLPNTSHVVPVQNLTNAILNDTETVIPPEEGRKAVDLILTIYKSSNEKREIILD